MSKNLTIMDAAENPREEPEKAETGSAAPPATLTRHWPRFPGSSSGPGVSSPLLRCSAGPAPRFPPTHLVGASPPGVAHRVGPAVGPTCGDNAVVTTDDRGHPRRGCAYSHHREFSAGFTPCTRSSSSSSTSPSSAYSHHRELVPRRASPAPAPGGPPRGPPWGQPGPSPHATPCPAGCLCTVATPCRAVPGRHCRPLVEPPPRWLTLKPALGPAGPQVGRRRRRRGDLAA